MSDTNKRWRIRNKEKVAAHSITWQRLRTGKITPGPCETCGAVDNIHAHHDDYSKPLKVRWLCSTCHRIHHAREKGLRISSEMPKTQKPERPIAEALSLRNSGMSYKQIARAMGISKGTAYKWLNDVPYE